MSELIIKPVMQNGKQVGIEYHGELIRCKDCKYYRPARTDDEADTCEMLYWFMDVPLWVKAEGYCWLAERRDHGKTD